MPPRVRSRRDALSPAGCGRSNGRKRAVVLTIGYEQGVEHGHPAVEVDREELGGAGIRARELEAVRGELK